MKFNIFFSKFFVTKKWAEEIINLKILTKGCNKGQYSDIKKKRVIV